jgi:hypothetical protein
MNKYYIVNLLYDLIRLYLNISNNDLELGELKLHYDEDSKLLEVTSNDGRRLTFSITKEKKREVDYKDVESTYYLNIVDAKLYLNNGDMINLYSDYPSFEDNQDIIDLNEVYYNLAIRYYEKDNPVYANIFYDLNKLYFSNSTLLYEFEDDCIKCGNKKISSNGNHLISIDGIDIPKFNSNNNNYNHNMERKHLYKELLENDYGIDSDLFDNISSLERTNNIMEKVKSFYNYERKEAKRAIRIRDKIMNGLKKDTIRLYELIGLNEANNLENENSKKKSI